MFLPSFGRIFNRGCSASISHAAPPPAPAGTARAASVATAVVSMQPVQPAGVGA
jgi:hypothetical protein